jgi:hypothetical protein
MTILPDRTVDSVQLQSGYEPTSWLSYTHLLYHDVEIPSKYPAGYNPYPGPIGAGMCSRLTTLTISQLREMNVTGKLSWATNRDYTSIK